MILFERQNYSDRKKANGFQKSDGGWEGIHAKEQEKTYRGDADVVHHDCGGSYTAVYIRQNSWTCTHKIVGCV